MKTGTVEYVKCDCQHCGGPLEVPREYLGQQHECPHCHQSTMMRQQASRAEPLTIRNKPLSSPARMAIIFVAAFIGFVVLARVVTAETVNPISGVFWVFIGLVLYFLPSLVATRKHRNFQGILILNLLTGWTFVGWVAALIWAVYRDKETVSKP